MARDRGLASPDTDGERPHARKFDGYAQRECSDDCCNQEPDDCETYRYYLRADPCIESGGGDPCKVIGPVIYVRCDSKCGETLLRDNPGPFYVIGDEDLRGWCWHLDTLTKYWTEKCVDPPTGFERLPCDATVMPDGTTFGCTYDCEAPPCPGRGGYLIPTFCNPPCGSEDTDVVVCPPPELDLSKCWFARDDSVVCGCFVIGPHSKKYEGEIGDKRVINIKWEGWKLARDPTMACCECCHGCDASACEFLELDNSTTNRLSWYPKCYVNAPCSLGNCPDVICCCGRTWHRTSVHYIRTEYDLHSFGTHTLIVRESWVMETKKYQADGLGGVDDLGCVAVSMWWRRRDWDNGELVRHDEARVSGCGDPDYNEGAGVDGCGNQNVSGLPTLSWIVSTEHNRSGWFTSIDGSFSIDLDAKKCSGVANPPQADDDNTSYTRTGSYTGFQDCNYRTFGYDLHEGVHSKNDPVTLDQSWIGRATVWTKIIDQGTCTKGCPGKSAKKLGSSGGVGGGGEPIGVLLGRATVTAQEFLP